MFILFFCLWPPGLAIKPNFNIAKGGLLALTSRPRRFVVGLHKGNSLEVGVTSLGLPHLSHFWGNDLLTLKDPKMCNPILVVTLLKMPEKMTPLMYVQS